MLWRWWQWRGGGCCEAVVVARWWLWRWLWGEVVVVAMWRLWRGGGSCGGSGGDDDLKEHKEEIHHTKPNQFTNQYYTQVIKGIRHTTEINC